MICICHSVKFSRFSILGCSQRKAEKMNKKGKRKEREKKTKG